MTDRDLEMESAPAPWINQWGQAVHENPWGHHKPNPAYVEWAQAHAVAQQARATEARARRAPRHRSLRIAAVIGVVATALVGANSAYAFWTQGGSGVGTAVTTTATVTVAAAAGTPTTPLYPGSTGDVTLKMNNPNAFALKLTAVTGNGTITPDAGHASCSPTGVSFTDQTGLNINLPASTNNIPIDLAGAASMSTASANGCQGATFTIPVSISVRQP